MTKKTPLTFETVDAVSVGGSYLVDPSTGLLVRQDEASTDLKSIAQGAQVADGAPGPAAELGTAADGVASAPPEAPLAKAKR